MGLLRSVSDWPMLQNPSDPPIGRFHLTDKVECVFPMAVVSILPYAEFGPNDHPEDASLFKIETLKENELTFIARNSYD